MPDNSAYIEKVGITIQVLRLLRGISQAELARRSGIRPNQVSRYETGQVLPQWAQLAKMLDALELDLGDFVFATRLLIQLDRVLGDLENAPVPDALFDELARAYTLRVERVLDAVRELSVNQGRPANEPHD